jgi:uncharacterized membrane protein YfcA
MGHMHFWASFDILYVFSGFLVGVLVGMTGVGGGSLMTPLLILLFGVPPATAVGTDLLFAALTKTVGTAVHGAARTVDWRLVGLLASGSVPGTIATLVIFAMADLGGAHAGRTIIVALAAVLLLTSIFLLFAGRIRARYADRMTEMDGRTVCILTIVLGLVMGVLVSATSVGAGAIGVTMLLLLHPKMSASRIVGSDIAHAVPLTLVAGVGHWLLGSVDWLLLAFLLIGSVPGIVVGSYVGISVPDRTVRTVLALVLIAVSVKLWFQ